MKISNGEAMGALVNRPLELDGVMNARDLGGYPTARGGRTARGRFLRSDSPHALSASDVKKLLALGLRTVVDLRSPDEVSGKPSKLSLVPEIRYLSIPIIDEVGAPVAALDGEASLVSMADIYKALLTQAGARFAKVFEAFAASEGLTLFNCAAGKDRTGLVAMLLLDLAGVPGDLVVADYAATSVYMARTFDAQRQEFARCGVELPRYYFDSKPEDMLAILRLLLEEYGGAEGYLRSNGLDPEAMRTVVAAMTCAGDTGS